MPKTMTLGTSLARTIRKIKNLFQDRDCEYCPCSWEDRSYEGECSDCGCVVYDDLYGGRPACFLPNFIKRRIRKRADRKRDEAMQKECDGITDWWEETLRKDDAMAQALKNAYPEISQNAQTSALLRMNYETCLEKYDSKNVAMRDAFRSTFQNLAPDTDRIDSLIGEYEKLAGDAAN